MNTLTNRTYLRGALIGGGVAALLLAGISVAVGIASGSEARSLLESTLPTVRFLASSVITASATTLALLLTLLSLSGGTEAKLESSFFRRLQRVAQLDVAAFIGGVVLLVSLVLPLDEGSHFSGTFYTVAFYVLTGGAAISAGLLVAVILALYAAARDLIETCWVDSDASPLAAEEPDE